MNIDNINLPQNDLHCEDHRHENILQEILDTVPDGLIEKIVIGKHWTAVSLHIRDIRLCGLASTIHTEDANWSGYFKAISSQTNRISAKLLASKLSDQQPALASIATATLNALLQYQFNENLIDNLPFNIDECNAEELIIRHGKGRRIAIIGHFPFTEKLKSLAGHLDVLEFHPQPGDLPADDAPHVLPQADVIAITGMTWVNSTLEKLLTYCSPTALVLLLGASTPLSPILFSHGIHYLCGALVKDIDPVMQAVADGAVYRQIISSGLQLVTIHPYNLSHKE